MRINTFNLYLNEDSNPLLVKECGLNYAEVSVMKKPEDVVQVMNDVFNLNKCAEEYVYLICLNKALRPVGFFELSHGVVSYACVRAREILIRALMVGATDVVLVHNHPSGCTTPSEDDIRVTRRLVDAFNFMDIRLLDHLIIAGDEFCAMRREDPDLFS